MSQSTMPTEDKQTNVKALRGQSAQEIIDEMIAMKEYTQKIVVIAESVDGHLILKSSYMDLRDQTFLIQFAEARNLTTIQRLQR